MEWYNPDIKDTAIQFGDFDSNMTSSDKAFVSNLKPKLEPPKSLSNLFSQARISSKPVSNI